MTQVTVVDYGVGNLLSVVRALEKVGATVAMAETAPAVRDAGLLVLPGVGAFAAGMAELNRRGLADALREHTRRERPLMGICLGMQMLLDESEEFGRCPGLGLIAGRVVPVPRLGAAGERLKIPHIGWAELEPADGAVWRGTPLAGLKPGAAAYFVHSFMAAPADPAHLVAQCRYGGNAVAAVVGAGAVWGCQFHPEKSGPVGLDILRCFLDTSWKD